MAGDSTFKKAQKAFRRSHKERHQPMKRQKLGLLEKHKDYVLRAKDFASKRDRLRVLQAKARERNPDEFYYKMKNTSIKNGVHVLDSARNEKFTGDMHKLMATQDVAYVKHKRQIEIKNIARLKSQLHLIDAHNDVDVNMAKKHTIFVDSKDEAKRFDAAKHFDTDPELIGRAANRLKNDTLDNVDIGKNGVSLNQAMKDMSKSYRELDARIDREEMLTLAMDELDMRKTLMTKGTRKKIGKDERGNAVFKWKQERKR
eukprot:CFRG1381T1